MTLLLMILDGYGIGTDDPKMSAIAAADTPNFDQLWNNYPHTELSASGLDVGLPRGQMGNSEVGHIHIGAGRQVLQDLTKIDLAVESGSFAKNPIILDTIAKTKANSGALHIFGLLSPGGIHSRDTHIQAMVEAAVKNGMTKVYVHAFLDGRDTPPKSAAAYIQAMEEKLQSLGAGKIASITGRYYAMDRDKRWDRVELAYDMLTLGKNEFNFPTAAKALEAAYARGESDEFVKPTAIHATDEKPIVVEDNDSIVFMNFRTDRTRELSYAFTDPNFNGFKREKQPQLTYFTTLTKYADDLKTNIIYPPEKLTNVLGAVLEKDGLTQLRIAETEKYAHVTFFVNGGREEPFAKEDRILVPSPKVATYDLQPEMSIFEVTDKLVAAINSEKYDVIICNYANADMVGHTGIFPAAKAAIEAVDENLGRCVNALKEHNGEMIVIADHGNAEVMVDNKTNQPFTAHTTDPVPFIYMGRKANICLENGKLSDVAPTMLYLLDVAKPEEMTGQSLVKLESN